MNERAHNPEAMAAAAKMDSAKQDKAKTGEENYLDSKSFQAANRVYQLESHGQSVL
jgi:hypothetical protein